MGPIYCDIFEPAEWIRYIAIYFKPPSECDTWPANKPPIYLQKSFISIEHPLLHRVFLLIYRSLHTTLDPPTV